MEFKNFFFILINITKIVKEILLENLVIHTYMYILEEETKSF